MNPFSTPRGPPPADDPSPSPTLHSSPKGVLPYMKLSRLPWKWINPIAYIIMVVINILANVIPFGGMTTGEIATLFPTPLTPAPITFAIWGVIYVTLFIPVFYQINDKTGYGADYAAAIGPWFLFSCVANIAWIFSWHARAMTPAMLAMVLLLCSLFLLKRRLDDPLAEWSNRWYLRLPIGLYTGWITVATLSNVSVWLKSLNFNAFGLPSGLIQVIVLLIGGAILTLAILLNHDPWYAIAAIWGYAGLLIRHLSPVFLAGTYPWTVFALFLCEAAFILSLAWLILGHFSVTRGCCPAYDPARDDID